VAAGLLGALISFPAVAQDSVVGRWSFSSPAQGGSPAFAGIYTFAPNGGVQVLMAGGIACVGSYQFDGHILASRMSACQTCTGGMCMPAPDFTNYFQWAAPVEFEGSNLNWLLQPPLVLHRN